MSANASWAPSAYDEEALERAGASVGVQERKAAIGEEAACLQELIAYGLKGACACEYRTDGDAVDDNRLIDG